MSLDWNPYLDEVCGYIRLNFPDIYFFLIINYKYEITKLSYSLTHQSYSPFFFFFFPSVFFSLFNPFSSFSSSSSILFWILKKIKIKQTNTDHVFCFFLNLRKNERKQKKKKKEKKKRKRKMELRRELVQYLVNLVT